MRSMRRWSKNIGAGFSGSLRHAWERTLQRGSCDGINATVKRRHDCYVILERCPGYDPFHSHLLLLNHWTQWRNADSRILQRGGIPWVSDSWLNHCLKKHPENLKTEGEIKAYYQARIYAVNYIAVRITVIPYCHVPAWALPFVVGTQEKDMKSLKLRSLGLSSSCGDTGRFGDNVHAQRPYI